LIFLKVKFLIITFLDNISSIMRCDPTISVFYSLHIILYCTIFTIPILFKNNGYTVNNTFNVYAIAEPVEFTLINIKNNTVDYTLTYLSEYNNISYNETV